MGPEPIATPLRDMLPYLFWGAVGLVVVFVLLGLARLWGWRTAHHGGSCGDVDLDHLRRQRMAGEISEAEYEAVRTRLAGAAAADKEAPKGPAEAPPETSPEEPSDGPDAEPSDESSINSLDARPPGDASGDDASERSRTDGQAQQ